MISLPQPPLQRPLLEREVRVHLLEIGPEFGAHAGFAPGKDYGVAPPAWMWAMLSDDERARHARFQMPRSKAEFLAGKVLTRTALGRALGVEPASLAFEVGERGKPRLASGEGVSVMDDGPERTDFSLSHTRGVALLAMARDAVVGCDVEFDERDPEVLRLAGRYFAESERQWITGLPRERALAAFYRLWTLKEAWLKALGAGMAISLQSFGFAPETIDDARPRLEFGDPEPSAWTFLTGMADERRPWSVAVRRRPEGPMVEARDSDFEPRVLRLRASASASGGLEFPEGERGTS